MPSPAPLTKNPRNNGFPHFGGQVVHDISLSKILWVCGSKCRLWRLPIPVNFVVACRASERSRVTAYVMVTAEARRFAASYELVVVVEYALPLMHGLEQSQFSVNARLPVLIRVVL